MNRLKQFLYRLLAWLVGPPMIHVHAQGTVVFTHSDIPVKKLITEHNEGHSPADAYELPFLMEDGRQCVIVLDNRNVHVRPKEVHEAFDKAELIKHLDYDCDITELVHDYICHVDQIESGYVKDVKVKTDREGFAIEYDLFGIIRREHIPYAVFYQYVNQVKSEL